MFLVSKMCVLGELCVFFIGKLCVLGEQSVCSW